MTGVALASEARAYRSEPGDGLGFGLAHPNREEDSRRRNYFGRGVGKTLFPLMPL
jgi:hypothetical protein